MVLLMRNNEKETQQAHWEAAFTRYMNMFGEEPSEPAKCAVKLFRQNGVGRILELGGGQGRDSLYFAQHGFQVSVVEYTEAGVDAIKRKAALLGLAHLVTPVKHDVRSPLPFEPKSFDACFSHMLYCMDLTTQERQCLAAEVRRVLKGNGINFYTVRNTADKHYGAGLAKGEDRYEVDGFAVHFFTRDKIVLLAEGYVVDEISEFEEGELPRRLFQVISRKIGD